MRRISFHIIRKILLVPGAIVLLTACSAPIAQQAAQFTPEGGFSASGEAPLADQWWTSFNDPVLNTLLSQAHSGNLSLKIAWDRLDQARAVARKSGAELFPKISGEAGFVKTRTENGSGHTISDSYSLGLGASYEIDLWNRIGSSQEASRLDALSQAEDLQTAALTLTAQVTTTWFQLVEQHQQIELLQQQLDINRKTLELIELQFRTGQVGIADLLQQRQVVENRKGLLALAEAQKKTLEHQLSVLLGEPPGESPAKPVALVGLPPLPQTGLRSDLLTRRPDIRSAWLQIKVADQRVAAAIADRFPSLSLTARATTTAPKLADLFDNWLANIAANIAAPLIDGGQRRAEVDRTRAVAAEALHSYGQTVLDALLEVEDTLAIEKQQRTYLESLDQQLKLAGQATERIRDRYLNGAEDYQRVLSSILTEQQLQRTRLSAYLDLLLNRVKMCRALAGGWDITRDDTSESM